MTFNNKILRKATVHGINQKKTANDSTSKLTEMYLHDSFIPYKQMEGHQNRQSNSRILTFAF